MSITTPNRLATTVAISAVIAAVSFASHAQPPSDDTYQPQSEAKQEKQDGKANKKAHQQQQQRLSQQQQQELIRQQQQSLAEYNQRIAQQQAIAQRNAEQLAQAKRMEHYRFQQEYYEHLRQQQERLQSDRYDYDNDPFYYTPPTYRYRRGDRYYQTNQYGAEALRKASNKGYQAGYKAGRADKKDKWRFDYQQSFAYQDANYGYDGRYVRQDDYNYYFREGFQRGYDDGYQGRRKYGRNTNGSDALFDSVLGKILKLEPLQ
jgi:flagellar biosynthesis GTPase FlhF